MPDATGGTPPSPPPSPGATMTSAPTAPTAPMNGRPLTNLDKLRSQYAEAIEGRRTTIPIAPGLYGSTLFGRYAPVEWEERRKAFRKLNRASGDSSEAELNYGARIISEACEEILICMEDGAKPIPLGRALEDGNPAPVRYDPRLAKALGIELHGGETATQICRLVFVEGEPLDSHFAMVESWLRGVRGDDEDEDEDGEGVRPT